MPNAGAWCTISYSVEVPTCTVYIRGKDGQLKAGHVTQGDSLFEVARVALAWFEDSNYWKGFRPTDDTILEVRRVGPQETVFYVRVGTLRNSTGRLSV